MLHNSGLYGSNEPPVNGSGSLNVPQMSDHIMNGNLNNSHRTPQLPPQPGPGPFNMQSYSSFAHQPLSMASQMAPYTNYPMHSFDRHFLPDTSRMSQGINENHIQDYSLPINPSSQDPLSYQPYPRKRPIEPFFNPEHRPRLYGKHHSLGNPQVEGNAQIMSHLTSTENHFQRNEEFLRKSVENKLDLSTKPQDRTDQEIARRKSLENTVRLIENLLMNTTNNKDKRKPEEFTEPDPDTINSEDLPLNDDSLSTDDDIEEYSETDEQNSSNDLQHTQSDPLEASTKDSDSDEDVKPDVNKIKHITEKSSVEAIIEVKVEPLISSADMNPFLEDVHGVFKDKIDGEIIPSDDSVAKAKEIIKDGIQNDKYLECQFCALYFINPKRYLIHTKWHSFGLTNEKRMDLIKQKESDRLEKKLARKLEKRSSNGKKNRASVVHTCKDCNKTFADGANLKKHRTLLHPDEVRECKICKKVIPIDVPWSKHHESHKNEAGDYQCSECPKKFKFPQSLTKHFDTHAEKVHKCQQCPKKFGSINLLKMHLKSHERMQKGVTHHCTYCGKGFYESYSLQVHERTHRNEKPFTCDICSASFGTNSSLKRHVKVSHNKLKPFECEHCHRFFATEMVHTSHVKRAHGDPDCFPHKCKLCPCRYMKIKDLRKHMYKVHPKVKEGKFSESDSE